MKVSPLRGIRYNQRIVGDLAGIICPPYDVISPEEQKLYYKRSNYGAIRLEFPEQTADRYQKAAIAFRQWLKDGILQADTVSSFYLHDQCFEVSGEKKVRRGLIARVKLEPWGRGIYPHEETSPGAKSDRLQLMRACRANFSPLFSLYRDSEQRIAQILSEASRTKPVIEASVPSPLTGEGHGEGAEAHILWAITDPAIKRKLSQLLSSQPLYIADGHHRYESALDYQQERAQVSCEQIPSPLKGKGQGGGEETRMKSGQSVTGEIAFQYVLMGLVDFSDPGLVVLPFHRLVRGIASSILVGLRDQLSKFFILESVPLEPHRTDASGLRADSCFGIMGLQPGSLVILRKRQDVSLETMIPGNRSRAYREFAVSILNHIVLDKVLGGAKNLDVAYTRDLKEAYQQTREGKYQLAFLLNPPQPEVVKAVADAQDRMPSKSTCFYPKLPAGLIINSLE